MASPRCSTASYLAGALAYLMNRQRDAFGLIAFDDTIVSMLPASGRSGHLRAVLVALERLKLGARTNVAKPLHDLAAAIRKRGLVVLISDLLDEPDRVIDGLKHFRYRGSDVVVFQMLDPDERQFPFEHAARFRDMETADEVLAVPGAVRAEYQARIEALIDAVPARAAAGRDRLLPARDVAASRAGARCRT